MYQQAFLDVFMTNIDYLLRTPIYRRPASTERLLDSIALWPYSEMRGIEDVSKTLRKNICSDLDTHQKQKKESVKQHLIKR